MISDDNMQRIQSWISIGANGYKVLMASLLAVFVPQKCPESAANECTMKDNFTDLTGFNVAVLIVNFCTLAIFLVFYGIEYYRENWCIEYLDYDENKAFNALHTEIEAYPQLKEKLTGINQLYYKMAITAMIFNAVNFVMSSVLVYGFYYLDYKSVTVMITYLILIADKLVFSLNISKKSYEEVVPNSAYRTGPVVYNTIDVDHRNQVESKIESESETEMTSVESEKQVVDNEKKEDNVEENQM